MMKRLLLLLPVLLGSIFSYSQIAFYDAQKLVAEYGVGSLPPDSAGIYQLPDAEEVYALLKQYVPDRDTSTKENIINSLADNPFIRFGTAEAHGTAGSFLKTTAASVSGIDVTRVSDAIAGLMIDRARQELTISFFNRFKKFAKEYPEFRTLFPKTTDNLENLLSYTYPQMLPVLRDGFFEDIRQMTYHLEAVLELSPYRQLLFDFPEMQLAVRSLRLLHGLEDGTYNAADIIRQCSLLADWSKGNARFKNTGSLLKLTAIISGSLRKNKEGAADSSIYVGSRDIRKLVSNEADIKVYMGLLYLQLKKEGLQYYRADGTSVSMTEVLKQQQNVLIFQNKIAEFISLGTKVNGAINKIKQAAGSAITSEDYDNYMNASLETIDFAFSIANVFDVKIIDSTCMTLVRKTNNLYRAIYNRQYTQAVNNALDLLQHLNALIDPQGTRGGSKPALKKLLDFSVALKPYALFMANVTEARTSDDIKAALENVVLPVGSSSIKKNTLCNISIQSYLGAFLTVSHKASTTGTWSDRFGVTAPIGMAYTPSFLSWQQYGALSLFGAVFDLGAIVDYRLQRDSTYTGNGGTAISKNYSIKLGQIFSPGVYLVYAAGANLPLALGFGGQYGPGLSKIDTRNNNELVLNPSWRWNFFLAVDIPFFTLKNKMRQQQIGR